MSTTPRSTLPAEDAADRGSGAASLVGIRIRPQHVSESGTTSRKRGDITLMLSRISAKPPQPETAEPVTAPNPPLHDVAPSPHGGRIPLRNVEAGPIDATMRDADPPPSTPEDPAERGSETGPAPSAHLDDQSQGLENRRRYDLGGRRISDIQGYWARLREGRRWPAWSDVDATLVGQVWANSFLLTCDVGRDEDDGAQPVVVRATRIGEVRPTPGSVDDVPITHAIVDWIRSVGADVAASGLPARETDFFETARGATEFRLRALPLGDDQRRVDHVLCHVSRV